jgi:hypothetical protein
MASGHYKGVFKALDEYLLYCRRRSKWLKDIGFLYTLGVLLLISMQFFDAVETFYSINIDGRFAEQNIVSSYFVESFLGLLLLKAILVVFVLSVVRLMKRYTNLYFSALMLWALAGFSTAVVFQNLIVMIGFVVT